MPRRRKRTKSMEDVSVSKLLDDFVDLNGDEENKRPSDMSDDEYIRMMVEKENKRRLLRERRKHSKVRQVQIEETVSENQVKEPPKTKTEEETFEAYCESDLAPEDETTVDEIMKTQERREEPELAAGMKVAVDFLQEEVTSSESKRKAWKTVERYRKPYEKKEQKKTTPIRSEKRAPVKRCQNCYYCIEEKKLSGSCWCHCTNEARSTHADAKGFWVRSRMNLPCWKPKED